MSGDIDLSLDLGCHFFVEPIQQYENVANCSSMQIDSTDGKGLETTKEVKNKNYIQCEQVIDLVLLHFCSAMQNFMLIKNHIETWA